MPVLHQTCRSKKRPRPALDPLPDEIGPDVKRRRSLPEPEGYCTHRPPRFWDALSKVRLSRGALREFERRTLQSQRQRQQQSKISVDADSSTTTITQAVKRFSRHGGPNLAHLRGFAELPTTKNAMSFASSQSRKRSSASSRTTNTTKTTKTSPYNGDFEQKLIDGGVYPKGYEYADDQSPVEPANLDDIHRALHVPRASLSPSRFTEAAFRDFERQSTRAANEAGAMADLVPIIAGEGRRRFHSNTDVPFSNLAPIVEDVTVPKPDIYDGARPDRIDPRVRHSLDAHILPSKTKNLPAAPNFFFEGKSASGRADVARRQACYDGAVGARAMHSLQNYGAPEPKYDGNAYSYSSTYHNGTGTLQLYGTHPTKPKNAGAPPEYHMTQIRSFSMTDTPRSFREGATAYRNLRDLAQSQRDGFIEQANESTRHVPSPSTTTADSRTSLSATQEDGSDTSLDELAPEKSAIKRSRHAPPPSSRHEEPSSRHAPRNWVRETAQPRAHPQHTTDDDMTTSRVAKTTLYLTTQPDSHSRHGSDSLATSRSLNQAAHPHTYQGASSRHQSYNTTTTQRGGTGASSPSPHHIARSRHDLDESADELGRRLAPVYKPAGGRHASDYKRRR